MTLPAASAPPAGASAGHGTARPTRRVPVARLALGYLLALIVAEALATLFAARLPASQAGAQVGLALHGALLLALLLHASLSAEASQHRFLLTLAQAPLIRLMSLSLPLFRFPFVFWYFVIGAPLIAGALMALRATGYSRAQVGLQLGHAWWLQGAAGLGGIGLGYLEYLILRPAPLAESLSLEHMWLPALILLVYTGFLEELIFRGLMQPAAMQHLGRGAGLLYVAAVFATLHLGYQSAADVAFVFVVGLAFGWVAARSGSLIGVTLAHGLTNITLFLIFPFIVGR